MRNLHILRQVLAQMDLPGSVIEHTSFDSYHHTIYATTSTNMLLGVELLTGKLVLEKDLEMEEGNKVVSLQYVPDTDSVVVATSGGDILALEEVSSGAAAVLDCIGSIETGIECMSWAPDFEVVLFTTRANTLLMMTQEWETIFEKPILPENEAAQIAARLAISEPSKIKLATTINDVRRVTEAKTVIAEQMSLATNFCEKIHSLGQNVITWRGDGQYFAVSSPNMEAEPSQTGFRPSQFRVWERSGKFFTASEKGVLTESVLLVWKPSGDIIASTQSLPTHDEVIFFEKNGLRHYEFKVRPDGARVIDLQWNASSDILSTISRLPSTSDNGYKLSLQLWSTRNYHWYLKQEFLFKEDRVCVNWDPEDGMVFTITTSVGDVHLHTLCWDTDVSRGTNHGAIGSSVAAVIDGANALLTALQYQVVPPPMCTVSINTTKTITQVAYDPANNLMTIHADGSATLYQYYQPSLQVGQPPKYNIVPQLIAVSSAAALQGLRQIRLIGNDALVALRATQDGEEIVHMEFEVIRSEKEGVPNALALKEVQKIASVNRVSRLIHNVDTGSIYLQYLDASVASYDPLEREVMPKPMMSVGVMCPWLASAHFEGDGEEQLIGLTANSKLYIGGVLMSPECNSFTLHSDYVLFTTLTHRLRSLSLHKTVQENLAILTPKQNIKFDDSSREVEQGSIVIAAIPHATRVVLQMPRGNLEAIEPRSLVLHTIRAHLNQKQYRQAFDIIRKQRINLNLFYDHKPTLFMENIATFLDQITDIDHLNLFISSLTSEDCTKTTYVDVFGSSKPTTAFSSAASLLPSSSAPSIKPVSGKPISAKGAQYLNPVHTDDAAIKARLLPLKIGKDKIAAVNKVNHVCDTLRGLMEKRDAEKFLLPILTALVCKDPPEIEKALRMVQTLRKAELESTGASSTTTMAASMTSEKALKYLVFLVDVNKLFDIALSMYDFDLVILVAQKSQKDPREYLPFLAELQKLETYFQRYKIDVHLSRWENALANLAKAGEERFGQCLDHITKYGLYNYALTVFDGEKRNQVLEIYGDSLMEQKKYDKAILTYRAGNRLSKAFEAAKVDANWRQAVAIGYQLGLPTSNPEEWLVHLTDLAASCQDHYKYEDAAIVFETMLNKPQEALTALLEGYLWDHAQLVCHRNNMSDRITTEVVPAILAAQEATLRTIQERTVKLTKYHNRLITVRANKHLQAESESMPMIEGSETSSMYSGSSQSSSQSKGSKFSKSSKASQRSSRTKNTAKVSGRKGSPNEEQYLVQELPGLLPSQRTQQEVSDLLRILFQFGFGQKALELQHALDEYIARGTKALSLINSPSPLSREEQQEKDASLLHADTLVLGLVNPPKVPHASLKTSEWRLSLLGE